MENGLTVGKQNMVSLGRNSFFELKASCIYAKIWVEQHLFF